MALPRLADILPDFGGGAQFMRADMMSPQAVMAPEPVHVRDVEAEIAAAVEAARQEVEERLARQHAEEIIEIERRHAAEFDKVRAEFATGAGERIAGALSAMERQVTDRVMSSCARVLGQFMGDALKERSLESLEGAIRRAIRDNDSVRIAISGPHSLYEPIAAALGKDAGRIEFSESTGFDITVTVGDRIFETRLGEWSTSVEEILA